MLSAKNLRRLTNHARETAQATVNKEVEDKLEEIFTPANLKSHLEKIASTGYNSVTVCDYHAFSEQGKALTTLYAKYTSRLPQGITAECIKEVDSRCIDSVTEPYYLRNRLKLSW